jgi:hypothetical protein
MKTKDRSCKIGEKRTGFGAEMTRILQEKATFSRFLSVGNAFWSTELARLYGGLAGQVGCMKMPALTGC